MICASRADGRAHQAAQVLDEKEAAAVDADEHLLEGDEIIAEHEGVAHAVCDEGGLDAGCARCGQADAQVVHCIVPADSKLREVDGVAVERVRPGNAARREERTAHGARGQGGGVIGGGGGGGVGRRGHGKLQICFTLEFTRTVRDFCPITRRPPVRPP